MKPLRNILIGGALAGTALIGGAVGASMLGSAGAATTSTDSSTNSSSDSSSGATPSAAAPAPDRAPDWSHAGHQANGKTEALLTDGDADKARAAAEAAVPGATAQRIETDADGAVYEVHMTKSDGSIVTVKLDSNFNVTETVDGMG